jgi:hypothetical protein
LNPGHRGGKPATNRFSYGAETGVVLPGQFTKENGKYYFLNIISVLRKIYRNVIHFFETLALQDQNSFLKI